MWSLQFVHNWKWKRFEQAETLLQRALAIYAKAQVPEHPEVAQMLKTYASLLFVLDRKSEAVEAGARAKTILAKLTNEDAI